MLFTKISLAASIFKTAPHFLVQRSIVRQWIMDHLKQMLINSFGAAPDDYPAQIWNDKTIALLGLVSSVQRADKEGRIAPQVFGRVIDTFLSNSVLSDDVIDTNLTMEQRHPFTVLVSPTRICNLRCPGCYAATENVPHEHLDFETFERIVREKRALWGSCFTSVSGGEPFMWKSKGKTLLDLVERQPDDYFLVYTNGTFIDDETAARMRQLGNVTPAISVEGFEAETDARRGKGVHRQIVKPCVFIPYAAANIYEIYNNGGDINQVFETELFKQLRQFQNDYAYARSNENVDNWLCPCPTRDHHERFQDILQHTQPKPIDESAAIAMQDRNYIEGMTEYGKQLYSISYPTWKARYQQTQAQDHIV